MTQQLGRGLLEGDKRGVGCCSMEEGWVVSIHYSSAVVVGADSVVGVEGEGEEGIFLCTEVVLLVRVCREGVDLRVVGDRTSASWQV